MLMELSIFESNAVGDNAISFKFITHVHHTNVGSTLHSLKSALGYSQHISLWQMAHLESKAEWGAFVNSQ